MHIPDSTLRKLEVAARRPAALRGWQLSLRTLFLLTAVCGLIAWFHQPLWAWGQDLWEFWFPSLAPKGCGPCGMG
jgi:hypothetical protein